MRLRTLAGLLVPWLGLVQAGATPTVGDESVFDGQVVCSQCWFEADRAQVAYGTAADLSCARRCARSGVAAALAVRDPGDGTFELLELGDPPPEQPEWLERIGRFVRVTGAVHAGTGDARRLEVASIEMLDGSPWPTPPAAGDADPVDLSWTDLSGHRLSLEGLRGRVVVLNFWATWCAPCLQEIPELVRAQQRHGVLGVQVVGAGSDSPEHADEVLKFARDRNVNFPIVLGATTDHMQAMGLGAVLPGTVVLDREGRVVARFRGVFTRAGLEAAIERALEGDEPVEEPSDEREHAHAAERGDHDPAPDRPTSARSARVSRS